jgi:hypothetical protein
MRTKFLIVGCGLAALVGGCSSSDTNCGDGGCLDAATFNFDSGSPDAGPSYLPASGKYKITAYTEASDQCMFGLGSATNSTNPLDWITVAVDSSGNIKVGNPLGTPSMASLGEGTLTGMVSTLSRSNHVVDPAPSTCTYDEMVTSVVTLDDPTKKTFGFGVTDKLTNRSMCTTPAGVGASCTSSWSWRLTPQP